MIIAPLSGVVRDHNKIDKIVATYESTRNGSRSSWNVLGMRKDSMHALI